jgi:hypothetical protein
MTLVIGEIESKGIVFRNTICLVCCVVVPAHEVDGVIKVITVCAVIA